MELTYTKHGDYYLPDLDIPAKEKVPANRYGRMHGDYLKKNNWAAYNELLLSGRLNRYLEELGEQADKMLAGAFIVMTVSVGCWCGILNYVKLRLLPPIRNIRPYPLWGSEPSVRRIRLFHIHRERSRPHMLPKYKKQP